MAYIAMVYIVMAWFGTYDDDGATQAEEVDGPQVAFETEPAGSTEQVLMLYIHLLLNT